MHNLRECKLIPHVPLSLTWPTLFPPLGLIALSDPVEKWMGKLKYVTCSEV